MSDKMLKFVKFDQQTPNKRKADKRIDDFKMKEGVRIPFRANVYTPANGNMLIEYKSITTEQQFSRDVFVLEEN